MFRVVAVPVVGCREPLGLWGWARGRVVRGAGRLPPRRARPFLSESAAIARRAGVVNGVAPLGGLAVGALGCGVLVQFAPVPTHLVYALLLGGMVVAAVLVFFLPETSARRPGGLASLAPRLGIPARLRPDVLALLPILVASWALGGLYLSLGPSVAAGLFGLGNHLIGGLVVTLLCGIGAATAFALRAWPTGRVLRIAAALLTAGTALTLVGVEFGSVALAVAGTAIAGSASVPSAQACFGTLARLAAPEERGELFAVAYVIAYLAFSVPAVLAGLASTVFGLHTTAVVYGLIVVVLGLVALVAQQIRSSRARQVGVTRGAVAASSPARPRLSLTPERTCRTRIRTPTPTPTSGDYGHARRCAERDERVDSRRRRCQATTAAAGSQKTSMSTNRCRTRFDGPGRVPRWTGLPLAWLTLLAGLRSETTFTAWLVSSVTTTMAKAVIVDRSH